MDRQDARAAETAQAFRDAAASQPVSRQRKKPPFSLRLTAEERARLERDAGSQPLGAYIRSRLFDGPAPRRSPVRRTLKDQKAFARLLGALGASRIANNLNQMAKAANSGSFLLTPDGEASLKDACSAVTEMRHELMERLEAWGRETTNVGGVAMTNAEAQDARQRVIENDEAYANWAVTTGRIAEDQKDEFKAAIRRKQELEDKRGRGTLTDAEATEEERLNRSRVGQAVDAATAENVRQQRSLDMRTSRSDANVLLGRGESTAAAYGDQSPFQELQAVSATPIAKPVPVSERVRATGLDL